VGPRAGAKGGAQASASIPIWPRPTFYYWPILNCPEERFKGTRMGRSRSRKGAEKKPGAMKSGWRSGLAALVAGSWLGGNQAGPMAAGDCRA